MIPRRPTVISIKPEDDLEEIKPQKSVHTPRDMQIQLRDIRLIPTYISRNVMPRHTPYSAGLVSSLIDNIVRGRRGPHDI